MSLHAVQPPGVWPPSLLCSTIGLLSEPRYAINLFPVQVNGLTALELERGSPPRCLVSGASLRHNWVTEWPSVCDQHLSCVSADCVVGGPRSTFATPVCWLGDRGHRLPTIIAVSQSFPVLSGFSLLGRLSGPSQALPGYPRVLHILQLLRLQHKLTADGPGAPPPSLELHRILR